MSLRIIVRLAHITFGRFPSGNLLSIDIGFKSESAGMTSRLVALPTCGLQLPGLPVSDFSIGSSRGLDHYLMFTVRNAHIIHKID
jgi:hypothetical protein